MTLLPLNYGFDYHIFLDFKGGGHNFGIVTRFTLQTFMGEERVSFHVAVVDSH